MEERRLENVTIQGAKIFSRNFQGAETEFNSAGDRNFCVMLDDRIAEEMELDGWNVKRMRPREDDPEQHAQAYLKVKVRMNPYPPIANLINSRGRKRLDEETIDQLDWCQIENVDLMIRPYCYPPSKFMPEGGVAAYLKAIYVTVREDDLERKYADIPEID